MKFDKIERLRKPVLECNPCLYSTFDSIEFETHNKDIHLNFKPYKCEKCDKSYKLRKQWISHKRRVHSSNRCKCDEIGCNFSTHSNYNLKGI